MEGSGSVQIITDPVADPRGPKHAEYPNPEHCFQHSDFICISGANQVADNSGVPLMDLARKEAIRNLLHSFGKAEQLPTWAKKKAK